MVVMAAVGLLATTKNRMMKMTCPFPSDMICHEHSPDTIHILVGSLQGKLSSGGYSPPSLRIAEGH